MSRTVVLLCLGLVAVCFAAECPDNCSNRAGHDQHGMCNTTTGACTCFGPYLPPNCAQIDPNMRGESVNTWTLWFYVWWVLAVVVLLLILARCYASCMHVIKRRQNNDRVGFQRLEMMTAELDEHDVGLHDMDAYTTSYPSPRRAEKQGLLS